MRYLCLYLTTHNITKFYYYAMSSINQLVSEIAHSIQQADNVPARRAIRLSIIHARNELIRKSYTNHRMIDKGLQQRVRLSLQDVNDGDLFSLKDYDLFKIKRTVNKVPRPVRLSNGLPFHSVRTIGVINPIEIPFIREASAKFYNHLPGMCNQPSYDYINEYIYIKLNNEAISKGINSIIVESVFEYPFLIATETEEGVKNIDEIDDDDEFLLPEDMIQTVKKIVLETLNGQVIREDNTIPTPNLVK